MMKNEDIFHDIYMKYHSTMIHYCIGRNISEEKAEDYVQLLFKLVWKKINQFKSLNKKQQKTWLYSSMNYIINNKSKAKSTTEITFEDSENDSNLSSNPINSIIEEIQFQNYIEEIKEQLSETEKELFKAIFEDKISYKDLSVTHGKSRFALRMQITRLRKKITPIIENIIFKE